MTKADTISCTIFSVANKFRKLGTLTSSFTIFSVANKFRKLAHTDIIFHNGAVAQEVIEER
jgi:hypothetical protein